MLIAKRNFVEWFVVQCLKARRVLHFHSKPLFTKLHHRHHTAMALPSPSSKRQFDVFLSFRGADTRHNFTDQLRQSLHRKGIDAFFDEKLRRGQDLSVLFDRIEQSKMSIVVFSENYANSTWCLDELWKILQCSEKSGHGVIPIFYKVKTSDVENQKGSFGAPFQTPKESFKGDEHKIGAWKASLRTASNIIGFVYSETRY